MVFQKPTPFRCRSANVAFGIKLTRSARFGARRLPFYRERLRRAAIWDEVKNKLNQSASASPRPARASASPRIAVQPEIILLRTSRVGARSDSTQRIEELSADPTPNSNRIIALRS